MEKVSEKYHNNKLAKVGDTCRCPSCNTEFVKSNYQQAFCKSKPGSKCKDKYWNTVDPNKRNNTTRISPASKRWSAYQGIIRDAQRTVKVRFGVWHDDDWSEADGGSGVTEN